MGNIIYLSIALGMLSSAALKFLLDGVFEGDKYIFGNLTGFFIFIGFAGIILASEKFRSLTRIWNELIPERTDEESK